MGTVGGSDLDVLWERLGSPTAGRQQQQQQQHHLLAADLSSSPSSSTAETGASDASGGLRFFTRDGLEVIVRREVLFEVDDGHGDGQQSVRCPLAEKTGRTRYLWLMAYGQWLVTYGLWLMADG